MASILASDDPNSSEHHSYNISYYIDYVVCWKDSLTKRPTFEEEQKIYGYIEADLPEAQNLIGSYVEVCDKPLSSFVVWGKEMLSQIASSECKNRFITRKGDDFFFMRKIPQQEIVELTLSEVSKLYNSKNGCEVKIKIKE